jgi:tetratricopeptide (TPR) repeat protein
MPSGQLHQQSPTGQDILALPEKALAALAKKEYGAAADLYRQLLQISPDTSAFWRNLSIALRGLHHYAAALGGAKRAQALDPGNIETLVNVGDCLVCVDRLEEALAVFSQAMQAEPQNVQFRRRYADTLRQCGRFEEALTQVELARKIDPNDVETIWQAAVSNLTLGRYGAGWKDYEVRLKRGNIKLNPYSAPRWAGEDIKGKTILLYEEQGFGDTILASRYIPLVKKLGARVLFGCRPVLHKLFSTIPGIDHFVLEGAIPEKLDYHTSLLSLPGIFGTELNTIPPIMKLCPAEKPPAAAAQLLELGKGRFKVGIVWSGSPHFKGNYKRAVPFSRFLPLMEIPGTQFYSLQQGPAAGEIAAAGADGIVPELGPHLKDFAETAAVLQELDLIIMTDSSVVHLAGALGRPVWNLLAYDAYWLYMANRSDSPWYPSLRLFRQPQPGDWESVFREVAGELRKTK